MKTLPKEPTFEVTLDPEPSQLTLLAQILEDEAIYLDGYSNTNTTEGIRVNDAIASSCLRIAKALREVDE